MAELQTLFFLGKGGTGKSTTSALLSLVLMEKGKKVLLASFDDAHNQSDIFQTDFPIKRVRWGLALKSFKLTGIKKSSSI